MRRHPPPARDALFRTDGGDLNLGADRSLWGPAQLESARKGLLWD